MYILNMMGTTLRWLGIALESNMIPSEARQIALGALQERRDIPYAVLASRTEAKAVETFDVRGEGGAMYHVEIQYLYDDGSCVRVWANVDDGGWTSVMPVTECFIKSPTELFIDED